MKSRVFYIVCVLGLFATPAKAQSDPLLNQAYEAMVGENYQSAHALALSYLRSHSRRYRADFILAVSECMLDRKEDAARDKLIALKDDYVLTAVAEIEVNDWITYCQPSPTPTRGPTQASTGISEISGAITSKPSSVSIAPAEPELLPLSPTSPSMSALVQATSYSGGDYEGKEGVLSPQTCSQFCRQENKCKAMTYVVSSKTCWLKHSVPAAQPGDDFVSATKNASNLGLISETKVLQSRMSDLVPSTSYSGDDYAEYKDVPSPNQCAELCRGDGQCQSMTYALSTRICWLKRSIPPAQHGSDFVSASKLPAR